MNPISSKSLALAKEFEMQTMLRHSQDLLQQKQLQNVAWNDLLLMGLTLVAYQTPPIPPNHGIWPYKCQLQDIDIFNK